VKRISFPEKQKSNVQTDSREIHSYFSLNLQFA
jgi:hypothetical protein